MSHFAVLVVTDEEPTQEVLNRVLQPFHEYECTGIDDEYVVDVDVTDRVEKEWQEPQKMLKLVDGSIHSRYSDMFYTGKPDDEIDARLGRKSFVMPAGAVEIEIPQYEKSALEGQTKEEFAEEYGGWEYRDGKFWDHTNPNSKWDWWQIGGRYSGRLQVVKGANAHIGERSWTNENLHITGVDQARKRDLDIVAMKNESEKGRLEWATDCCEKAGLTMTDLNIAVKLENSASEAWTKLEDPKPRGAEYYQWLETLGEDYKILAAFRRKCFELPNVPANMTVEEWIAAAPPVSAWSVLMDGEWHESGEMGWWGISSNDKPDWDTIFIRLWNQISNDQWISFVDCHI